MTQALKSSGIPGTSYMTTPPYFATGINITAEGWQASTCGRLVADRGRPLIRRNPGETQNLKCLSRATTHKIQEDYAAV